LGIFTSPQEGRGLVTIEHHCHGNGVIATDIPPTREIFQNYSNPVGVLIDNTDPDRAARQSVEFLDAYQRNPILRQQISEEAFRARAIFDPALLTTTFVDTILGQV
jgi:glycosyltransferase involved in cell wall biosynthesis